MASLQENTMDLSFGEYDCPIAGLLGVDPISPFTNDAYDGIDYLSVLEPAAVHTLLAGSAGFGEFTSGQGPADTDIKFPAEITDILGCDIKAVDSSFNCNNTFDLESLVTECQSSSLNQVASQHSSEVSPVSSLADFSFTTWKLPHELSAPGSPDSGFVSLQSPQSSNSSDGEPSPCATPAPAELQGAHDLGVSAEDLKYLESLWGGEAAILDPSSNTGPQALVMSVVLEPSDSIKLPIKSSRKGQKTSSKPTKSLTYHERKERKRAQNKNAATRYREKKRAEAQVIYEEQTGMEETNKNLQEKVTLLTREIQYMKELLIEVYRTKGLVE